MQDKYPIAFCPGCHRTVLYSDNPKEKNNVKVCLAEPGYHGAVHRCPRCNTMYRVIEKPKVAAGFVALPIYSATV